VVKPPSWVPPPTDTKENESSASSSRHVHIENIPIVSANGTKERVGLMYTEEDDDSCLGESV